MPIVLRALFKERCAIPRLVANQQKTSLFFGNRTCKLFSQVEQRSLEFAEYKRSLEWLVYAHLPKS